LLLLDAAQNEAESSSSMLARAILVVILLSISFFPLFVFFGPVADLAQPLVIFTLFSFCLAIVFLLS
jgi:hypothetical protein